MANLNANLTNIGRHSESELAKLIAQKIDSNGGWLPFDHFMDAVLYTPNLGYYTGNLPKIGAFPNLNPAQSSDFVTAPELSPLFGWTLAEPVAQALKQTKTNEIWEFGAGTGALAHQILSALSKMDCHIKRYVIVDVSMQLREKQRHKLAEFLHLVEWVNVLPDVLHGVVIGNEVLDAMPVKLLHRHQNKWWERGVVVDAMQFTWCDRLLDTESDLSIAVGDLPKPAGTHDYTTEIHQHAQAFITTIAQALTKGSGAAFFIDYGFPESEYHHPERHMGTLMCHHQHTTNQNPLENLGAQDITAHVNFTDLAWVAHHAGLATLGYTSQGRFLLNAGLLKHMENVSTIECTNAIKLISEHEMGELFKVIAWCTDADWECPAFALGDRTHTL